jgi:hypothetical protein
VSIERRHGNKVALLSLVLTAVTQMVVIIWFAAKLSTAVDALAADGLKRDARDEKREIAVNVLAGQVVEIAKQLAVLNERLPRRD